MDYTETKIGDCLFINSPETYWIIISELLWNDGDLRGPRNTTADTIPPF